MTYPFSRFITFLAALLVACMAWQWMHQPEPLVEQNATSQREHHFDVDTLKSRQIAATNAVAARERPLFTPSRKPFMPAPAPPPIPTPPQISVVEVVPEVASPIVVVPAIPSATPEPPTTPPQTPIIEEKELIRIEDAGLQLKGIMINHNTRKALITSTREPVDRWLQIGDSIAEWQIVGIEDSQIIVKNGETRGSLQLYVDKSAN